MKSRSIEEGWLEFAASVIPLDAPPSQYTDMRIAFYAGASLMLQATAEIAEIAHTSEHTAVDLLERLHVERRQFLHEMQQRKRTIQ
jgi:hypothetical protein